MKLVLTIRTFDAKAQFDHFDDGSFEAFDLVMAEVVGGERAGQTLRVLVESDSPLAEQWNRPGTTLTVSIDPDRLAAQVLFAGAFTIEGEP